jgi:hypothetical protein
MREMLEMRLPLSFLAFRAFPAFLALFPQLETLSL